MDFRGREVSFQEAERRYAELQRQRDAGSISDEEFEAQRQQLRVQDDEGRWWAKLGEAGEWHYRDGSAWVRGTPPAYQEIIPEPPTDSPPAQTSQLPHPTGTGNRESRRWRVPRWIPVVGLGGIALIVIVLVAWVLVPYLRGEAAPGGQGASSAKRGGSAQNGAALDAAFIHRATSENISANSTYLDNSLINGNPNAILYITPNWNPGGSAGTYNNHSVGVWYDPDRQRWAIFNQDRETMPEGAAFNVAVLKEPTKAK